VTGETVTIRNNTFTIPAGGVTIRNLQTSDTEYAVVEVDSPDGYVITNDKPVKFKVTSGELTDKTMTTGVEYTSEGNDFTIPNAPGVALPNTGGPGTNMLYFFGIMLAGLAGTGLVMKRRRRNTA
jgi:LPXTG-motif cell wall-anchored protein